jgi:hypothetical protein
MYIRIDHPNRQIEIQEHFRSPMVYLDHWALNDIALNDEMNDKFVKIMNSFGGTLRISVMNMVELSKQKDKSQVELILDMIKKIDDCGLINIDPKGVVLKENSLIADPESIFQVKNPSAELDLIGAYLMANNYPSQWNVSGMIKSIIGELPTKRMTESNENFLDDMKRLLSIGRTDDNHLKRVKKRFNTVKQNGPNYQRATREVLQMALDFILQNKNMKMLKYSEWSDLFHLIVPVSYCDIVLMDKRWKTFINQTGLLFPKIAMIFDKRSILDFFKKIENWQN